MRFMNLFVLLLSIMFTQQVLADETSMSEGSENKSCVTIVKGCLKAGYTRANAQNMRFWQDCMKPVLMGKTVKDVNIDAAVAKDCRTSKIDEMKKELSDLESVS